MWRSTGGAWWRWGPTLSGRRPKGDDRMTIPVLLLFLAQASPAPACDTARIRQVILELQARQQNVGVQVAVRAGGRLVYSRSFGFADLEDSTRVTPRTILGVASVTKAVTGLVTLATPRIDRKSTRLNSSHSSISYAVFCLKKKKK